MRKCFIHRVSFSLPIIKQKAMPTFIVGLTFLSDLILPKWTPGPCAKAGKQWNVVYQIVILIHVISVKCAIAYFFVTICTKKQPRKIGSKWQVIFGSLWVILVSFKSKMDSVHGLCFRFIHYLTVYLCGVNVLMAKKLWHGIDIGSFR